MNYNQTDGIERQLAAVTLGHRFVEKELDAALLQSGLAEEFNKKLPGVARGMGKTPSKVFGFSIRHHRKRLLPDGTEIVDTDYKEYCGPFRRSLVGECTVAVRLPDDGGHQIARRVCPYRLAHYTNKRVFSKQLLDPQFLEYLEANRLPANAAERALKRKHRGHINVAAAVRTYTIMARLVMLPFSTPHGKKRNSRHGICLVCGERGRFRCFDCSKKAGETVPINVVNTDTPPHALRALAIANHQLFSPHVALRLNTAIRNEVEAIRPDLDRFEVVPRISDIWEPEILPVVKARNDFDYLAPIPAPANEDKVSSADSWLVNCEN